MGDVAPDFPYDGVYEGKAKRIASMALQGAV